MLNNKLTHLVNVLLVKLGEDDPFLQEALARDLQTRDGTIIWQHVRQCWIDCYKTDKNAEGIQGRKITGDGINQ